MDAKDLRVESALGTRNNDGTKYSQGGASLQGHRSKQYQDNSSNSLGKVDAPPARPCAVIGPDRVVPPPLTTDTYLKKAALEPWLTADTAYRRPPDYPHKLTDYQHPSRNISPRQTFQENMQRIMVPPIFNSAKLKEDHNFPVDANASPLRNNKLNAPAEGKYCEVPYTVNPMTNEQKNVRSADISVSNMNSVLARGANGWPPGSANVRPAKPYAHPEVYQYPDYPSCAGPRPMLITRPHRTAHEEPGPVYSDPYYHERFKPYPSVKERYPQPRYEYINYSNPFHPPPPFPTHKYDPQKPIPPNLYPGYSQVPLKYLDPRMAEHVINGYQRPSNQQGSFNNVQFRNQVIQSTYGPVPGNCLQNKYYPYPPEGPVKPIVSNKMPYDSNNKMYIEFENARAKNYPTTESFYVNEMARHPMKGPVLSPNYASVNMHPLPPHPYYRKENPNPLMKNYEYSPHFRNIDSSINMPRLPPQYSLNSFAISPSDSSTSNDTNQTHGTSQEDCGYVSQSSTASIRSMDSSVNRIPHDPYRKYDYRYGPLSRLSRLTKPESNPHRSDGSKDKKNINVRQFLQMWNEGEDEGGDNNNKVTAKAVSNNANDMAKQYEASNQEQLYVLGLVNVPSEELGKYEHIQKVSKLPENIKGYNNIELLNQFEEVIESSNLNNYNMKPPTTRDFHVSLKNAISMQGLGIPPMMPRPASPLDVEAKISQSVIHKEVGCNFEIKPCSPKMLNVEVAAPIQTVLDERVIEKVSNPLNIQSPILHHVGNNTDNISNGIKHRDRRPNLNDNSKVNSCKMLNTPFSGNNPDDPIKGNNYTLQDLESNAGIGIASLPRLDNDCELNFPEVNQQFINANKVESVITPTSFKDLPSLDIDPCDTATKDPDVQETDICKLSPSVEKGKELPKLSKYRKLKRKVLDNNDSNTVLNHQVMRTDSVIIKNPDNIKSYEDSVRNASPLNELTENALHGPINLTVNTDTRVYDEGSYIDENEDVANKPNEFAIDFSLNSNEHYGYKYKPDSEKTNSNKDKILNDYSCVSEKKIEDKSENSSSKTYKGNCDTEESDIDNLNKSGIPLNPKEDKLKNIQYESNCNTGKSGDDDLSNSYITEDSKQVSVCHGSVINFFTDTISEDNKVESPNVVETDTENDAMSKLLCKTPSGSVQDESTNLDSENIMDLNDQKDNVYSSSDGDLTAKQNLIELDLECSIKAKTNPSIDYSVIHHHKSEPFNDDSTSKEVSMNTMSPIPKLYNNFANDTTDTVIPHSCYLSSGKDLEQSGINDFDQKEASSISTQEFYDDMDVEHKMESLFSEKSEEYHDISSPKKRICVEGMETKSDTDTQNEKLSHIHSREPHNLRCAELPESKDLNYGTSENTSVFTGSRSNLHKKMFSPWIQKLILNDEGAYPSAVDNFRNKLTLIEPEKKLPSSAIISESISESEKLKSVNIDLTEHPIDSSITDCSSDKSSDDDTDDTCSEILDDIEKDSCFININDVNNEFTHAIKVSDIISEPTLDKVEISSNAHKAKVDLTSESFLLKNTTNLSTDGTINENSKLIQERTDLDTNDSADVESNMITEEMSMDINPPTSGAQINSHDIESNSDELKSDSLVLSCLNSDFVTETTVNDIVKPNVDETKPEFCFDESKTIPFVDNITVDKGNVKPLSCIDGTEKAELCQLDVRKDKEKSELSQLEVEKAELCQLDERKDKGKSELSQLEVEKAELCQLEIKNDKEHKLDDQSYRNNVVEQVNYSTEGSDNSDSGNNTCSSEDDGKQENLSNDSILNKATNPEVTSSKKNSSVAELTFDYSETAEEIIIDTLNQTNTNNLNEIRQTEPDTDLMASSTRADEKCNMLCDIPEGQKVFNSVDEGEAAVKASKKNSSVAALLFGSSEIAEESIIDTQNLTDTNTLNEIRPTESDTDLMTSSTRADEKCNSLFDIPKEQELFNSVDEAETAVNASKKNSSVAELTFASSEIAEKSIIDTQIKTDTNTWNEIRPTEPDTDLMTSSTRADEKCNSLFDIPEEQELFNSVDEGEAAVNASNKNSSVAEPIFASSGSAEESIIDTQNQTNTNNLNEIRETEPDTHVMTSSTRADEKFNSLCNISEEQEVFNSVDEGEAAVNAQHSYESKYLNEDESTHDELINDTTIETSLTSAEEFNLEKERENDKHDVKFKYSYEVNFKKNNLIKKRILKRSYSESELDGYSLSMKENSKLDHSDSNFLILPNKRKKNLITENCIDQLTSENYCNIIHNNRRNSIATICEQNVSFCILIDDTCIITEDVEESDKLCFTEISQECLPCIENDIIDDDGGSSDFIALQEEVTSEHSDTFTSDYIADKALGESWVEDVACVETVVSDDIAEDIVISASASPRDDDSSDCESNNDESGIFSLNEHTDKLKDIYGDKMCSDDAQLVETLYRTPQMDVNKTLVHREAQVSDDCHRYYDVESLERVLSESNNCELKSYESNSIADFTSSLCPSGFVASDKTPDDKENVDLDSFDDNSLPFGIKNIDCNTESEQTEEKQDYSPMFHKKTQDDTVHSCESSIDNVFSYNQPGDSPKYVISSSSEVSSTTSEDKNSNPYLKINKYREASISKVNGFNSGSSISCKYTEKEDCLYSNSKLPSRPLITKAAQKYIPPLKDTIPDLKVKLPLPQNSLKKLKQLKISKEEPKPKLNVNKHDVVNVLRNEIPKKPKPKFEDVLKSIDEIQFKKHKEKSKKPKRIIPKVVIKKSENGSHYASTLNKDKFNPDLTGRKWQPWVFLEKNNFIDKMALKRKTKAIYSHRKKTYVLAEKFQKYKSISSAKFVISQPKLNQSSQGQLKYTIRLKHSY